MLTTRRTARRQRFLPAALAFCWGLILPGAATAQFSASPNEITLVPGSSPAATIVIQNEGTTAEQAQIYLNDWDRDDNGVNRFSPTGTVVGSCGDRVKVFPASIRLEAGARQSVTVTAEPGAYPSPCWTVVFIETTRRPSTGGNRIVYLTRLGVKVYVEPPAQLVDAEIVGFGLERRLQFQGGAPVDTTQDELAIRVRNTGGRQARFKGKVEIRDLQNAIISTIPIDEVPVLPGASRRIAVALPTLAPGKYVALAVLGFGGDDDLAAQLELEIR